jgi:serine/threonine protein kinase
MAARVLSSATLNTLRSRFGDAAPPAAACEAQQSQHRAAESAPGGSSSAVGTDGALPPLDISHVPALVEVPAAAEVVPHDVPLHPGLFTDFAPLHKIGEGGYAVVLRVRERASGKLCVLKKINDAFSNAEDAQRVFREVAYQRSVRHPNLLPLSACYVSSLSPDLYLLCPHMTLDLHEAVRSNRLTSPLQRQCVAYQLTCALGHMHAQKALHRDLKPPNVLLDPDCRVMLCDFGLTRTVPEGELGAAEGDGSRGSRGGGGSGLVSRSVGSRWYRAPELILGASAFGPAVDMWSLGCVLAELMSGRTLLLGASNAAQLAKICALTSGGSKPDAADLADMHAHPEVASALLAGLPSVEPMRLGKSMPRAPAEGIDLCRELLQLRPSSRLDAGAVLRHRYFTEFVKDDANRRAYAARSCAPAAPYRPPLDDSVRKSALEYRQLAEASIAIALAEPVSAPPASATAGSLGDPAGDDDMGA